MVARNPKLLTWALAACALVACSSGESAKARAGGGDSSGSRGGDRTLVVFNAGSLALPLRAALDSFAAREDVTVQQENAGSLETAAAGQDPDPPGMKRKPGSRDPGFLLERAG